MLPLFKNEIKKEGSLNSSLNSTNIPEKSIYVIYGKITSR